MLFLLCGIEAEPTAVGCDEALALIGWLEQADTPAATANKLTMNMERMVLSVGT